MKKIIMILSLLFPAMLLTSCATKGDDPALKPMPSPKVASTLSIKHLWSHNVGKGASGYYLYLPPALAQDKIFAAAYNGTITAFTAQKGKRLWRHNYNYHFVSGVKASHGLLFVVAAGGHLLAIKQSNGKLVWSAVTTAQVLAAPQVANDTVFIHAIDGSLTAYRLRDGQQLWQFKQPTPNLVLHLGSQPQVLDGTVFTGFSDGKLTAVNAQNGQAVWVQQIAQPSGSTVVARMVDISMSPIVSKHFIFIAGYQGNIVALATKTGKVVWQHKLSAYAGMAADKDRLYVTDARGALWAFDRQTGAVVWRNQQLLRRTVTAPAVVGRYLVVGDAHGYLYFLSRQDGHFVAKKRVNLTSILGTPQVAGHRVFAYTMAGRLAAYAIDRSARD